MTIGPTIRGAIRGTVPLIGRSAIKDHQGDGSPDWLQYKVHWYLLMKGTDN